MFVLGLLAIPALIAINAYFVAIEFALVAMRKTRIEELVKQGVRGAQSVWKAHEDLDRSVAAAQLGITLASIALGAVGESVLAHFLVDLFDSLPNSWEWIPRHALATGISVVFITIFHVILGEQVPKLMAIQTADRIALWTSRPLLIFSWLCAPILRLMNFMGNVILRMLGYKPGTGHDHAPSVQELGMIVEDTHEAGLLDSHQAFMLQNVFRLSAKTVKEVMLPVDKMDALEKRTPFNKVLEFVRQCGHTRIPVYDKSIDNIVGILNTKNLFYFFTLGGVMLLEDAIYDADFLDPDQTIGTALQLFRNTRRPMAIVRNKQGKVLGLLTLEDVLEEIVGDLEDEHDVSIPIKPRPKGGGAGSGGNSRLG